MKKPRLTKQPASAAELRAAVERGKDAGTDTAWAVFFTVLRDKHGFGIRKRIPRLWEDVCRTNRELPESERDCAALEKWAREYAGIDVKFPALQQPQGPITRADVLKSEKRMYKFALLDGMLILLLVLRRVEKYGPDRIRQVWREMMYLVESIEAKRIKTADLQKVLAEEVGMEII